MKNPIFKLKNLKHQSNNKVVLDIKKLEIHRGSCYVIYGDIGSGKSMFLKFLYKLIRPFNENIL